MMQNDTLQAVVEAVADSVMSPPVISLMGGGTTQMPPQASTVASDIDALYYFIFWGCTAFFILIIGLCAFFLVKYRRRPGDKLAPRSDHSTSLELTWTIVPFLLLLVVFVWGFKGYMVMQVTPGNALEYYVTGKKWMWEVKDPNGNVTLNEMVVPVNTPIKIILKSDDILHSYYIPAFRIKQDAVPNRYNTLWFEANQVGVYDLFCTEYCGSGHSGMLGKVTVVTEEAFKAGFGGDVRPEDMPLAQWGERLYTKKACVTCHSIDGSKKTGPTWQGVFGMQEQLTDGSSVTVDENYIRNSILNPNDQVVAGYTPSMPTYAGTLSDEDIEALIEFIKAQK